MKKTFQNLILLLLISNSAFAQLTGNSNWTHVGPKSSNQQNGNGFETSQLNNVIIDPNNSQHLFVGGKFGGLWESYNRGASWSVINTNPTGFNGVGAMEFKSSTELLVGNYHPNYREAGNEPFNYSTGIFVYHFINHTWQALGSLPAGTQKYVITDIAFLPGSSSKLFACTSIGLFKSIDGGATWTQPLSNCYIESIDFIKKSNGTDYFSYVIGSNVPGDYATPHGSLLIKESGDGGTSFPVDLSSSIPIPPSHIRSHSVRISVATNDNNPNGDRRFFVFSILSTGAPLPWDQHGWDSPNNQLDVTRFVKNIISGSVTTLAASTNGYGAANGPDKSAMVYDPVNNWVWYGCLYLNCYNLSTNTVTAGINNNEHSANGGIHMDMKDMEIQGTDIFIATDGGLTKASLSNLSAPGNIYFNRINNGLHVMLINGFSGSADSTNLYAIGGQDIVNTDIYDEKKGANRYTHITWENDGALIDKFDSGKLMFLDRTSYDWDPGYIISEDWGQTISASKLFYEPLSNSATFEQGAQSGYQKTQGFITRLFYQDPYRKGRIFYVKNVSGGIHQYDYTSKTFVNKINPFDTQQYIDWNTASLNYKTGEFGIAPWVNINSISFSPQTINSLYFTVNGNYDYDPNVGHMVHSRPTVMKYIGNNIDDCWVGHNLATYTDINGTHPQWQSLTSSLWENLASIAGCSSCSNVIGDQDLENIALGEVETSPWNKNLIYVMVYIPNNNTIKVLKYDGSSWSNYSSGLPLDEYPFSMIMDHASNDGIYLSTDKGVYYKDASMANWAWYSTDLPIMYSRQMEINYKENSVRAGTYGRGIWKSPLVCPSTPTITIPANTSPNRYLEADYIVTVSNPNPGINIATSHTYPTVFRATTKITLNPGFKAEATADNNFFQAFIHGCNITTSPSGGTSTYNYYKQITPEIIHDIQESIEEKRELIVYPNPALGSFIIVLDPKLAEKEGEEERQFESESGNLNKTRDVCIYNSMGSMVYSKQDVSSSTTELSVSLQNQPKGVYFIRVVQSDGETKTAKVILQ